MLGMLLAYDAAGVVVATLDHLVQYDDDGNVIGLVDFGAHEESGRDNTAIWTVSNATGSKVWPEWLGGAAHNFRAELQGPPGRKHIGALVHKTSGYRRERAAIEAAIAARIVEAGTEPADLRDIVGGPDRPLILGATGRDAPRPVSVGPTLPVIAARR